MKLSMPLICLVEEHDATMQPHFDPSVFQNLNFQVFSGKKNQLCCSKIHFHK